LAFGADAQVSGGLGAWGIERDKLVFIAAPVQPGGCVGDKFPLFPIPGCHRQSSDLVAEFVCPWLKSLSNPYLKAFEFPDAPVMRIDFPPLHEARAIVCA